MVQGAQARQLSIDFDISKAFAAPLLTLRQKANYYTFTRSASCKASAPYLYDRCARSNCLLERVVAAN